MLSLRWQGRLGTPCLRRLGGPAPGQTTPQVAASSSFSPCIVSSMGGPRGKPQGDTCRGRPLGSSPSAARSVCAVPRRGGGPSRGHGKCCRRGSCREVSAKPSRAFAPCLRQVDEAQGQAGFPEPPGASPCHRPTDPAADTVQTAGRQGTSGALGGRGDRPAPRRDTLQGRAPRGGARTARLGPACLRTGLSSRRRLQFQPQLPGSCRQPPPFPYF